MDLRSFKIRLEFESAIPIRWPIRFESDDPIRKFLNLQLIIDYWTPARFDSYSIGSSWNMLSLVHAGQLYTLQLPFSANIVAVSVAEDGDLRKSRHFRQL